MRIRGIACVAAVVMLAVLAGGASPARANPAAWIGGKLLSGAASGATSAVVGNLLAQAGLDPTANALNGIFEQLQQLSKQMSDLQATSKQSLEEILGARFESQFNELKVTTIRDLQADYVCYLDPKFDAAKRRSCKAHFETEAPKANLGDIVNTYNDRLTGGAGLSVVQTYAKMLVGSGHFYTKTDQHKVNLLFTWLDSLQVAAAVFYTETKNFEAVKDPAQADTLHASAIRGAELLAEHRAEQQNKNPVPNNPGALDTRVRVWIKPQAQGFMSHSLAEPHGDRWALPSTDQLVDMVKDRGDKTVKKYLAENAGLDMSKVDEFGNGGQLWTSTRGGECGPAYPNSCWQAVSTNNAVVRDNGVTTAGPNFPSILISGPTAHESARYSFIWTR